MKLIGVRISLLIIIPNYIQKNFESTAKYYYVSDDDKLVVEEKIGACSKLRNVKERLDLLGYNMYNLKICMKKV